MPTRFTLPHLDITAFKASAEYSGQGGGGSGDARVRAEHGARLQNELRAAFRAIDAVSIRFYAYKPATALFD